MAAAPPAASPGRTVLVFARDRAGRPLSGTTFGFALDGVPAGTVPRSEGRASIQVGAGSLSVAAEFGGQRQERTLAAGQDSWTFVFDVDTGSGFMEKRLPLLVGLGLVGLAVVLAFVFGTPTTLQTRMVLVLASLGGGLIATEIPGMLKVDVKLGTRVAIGATGALAVFVLLYLVVPAT